MASWAKFAGMNSPVLDLERLVVAAFEVARGAGRVVMKKRNESLHIRGKQDGSPATAADHASEEYITAELQKIAPHVPVVAEEAVSEGRIPELGDGPFWLVDPLDGTKDFIAGESEFAINIALVIGAVPVIGVIHAPALEDTFVGAAGQGASRVRGHTAEDISARAPQQDGLVVLSSRRHGNEPELAAYLSGIKVIRHKRASSALKFGLLASGEADIYPRFGRAMGWDVAAGHAIICAAGGRITTADGHPIIYRTQHFDIPSFIARGRLNG